MKKQTSAVISIFLFVLMSFVPRQALADDQMFLVSQLTISLGHYDEYRTDVKKAINILKKHKYPYSYSASAIEGGKILWFTPLDNYAMLDKKKKHDKAFANKLSDEENAVFGKLEHAILTSKQNFLTRSKELSFSPKNIEGYHYFEGRTYKYHASMDAKIEVLAKKFKSLYEKHKLYESPYSFFKHGIGLEGRTFTIVSFAKSKKHMAILDEMVDKKFANDAEVVGLQNEVFKSLEVIDVFTGHSLTDLRYTAP